MIAFLVIVLVVALGGTNIALLVDRFRGEAAHRTERERLLRAAMAKHMPEFMALERVIEHEAEPRRLKAVGDPRDPNIPLQPEGL